MLHFEWSKDKALSGQNVVNRAYRGYLIRQTLASREYFITRDGQHISWATSPEDAKRIINELLD